MSASPAPGPYGIIGLGLVGGSLALALKRLEPTARVIGYDSDASTCTAALEARAVDHAGASPDDQLSDCRVVFIATPLGALTALLPQLRDLLHPQAVLTDVIGVKAAVARAVERDLPAAAFIGGHPMAGGEHGGFARARPDLFDGCSVALCPERDADASGLERLWGALGAVPAVMTADEHDRQVAVSSHLPYLAALAMTEAAATLEAPQTLFGRGFLNSTGHAAFAPEVMAAVCAANPHLPEAARSLARILQELAQLAEKDAHGLSQRAAASRVSAGR